MRMKEFFVRFAIAACLAFILFGLMHRFQRDSPPNPACERPECQGCYLFLPPA
jgi:predicted PurR-regulated permease PerM